MDCSPWDMNTELEAQIRRDMQYLAGTLPHRGAYTDHEKAAAEYLRDRLAQHTPDVEVDEFTSIESYYYFFASYYGEFFFVALVALWWPIPAFIYGLLVFLLYLGEFTSYRLAARLLPQFESQNVVGRFLAVNPSRLVVVTANYDSPKESQLSALFQRWLRPMHLGIVICMMTVLLSVAMDAFLLADRQGFQVHVALRWAAVAWLICAALVFLLHERTGEFSSGAVDNAGGVATLLALARRFEVGGLPPDTEVWLVATGAKDAWMSGMYRLVHSHRFDRETTYFLHLDRIHSKNLRYVQGEGLLHFFPCSKEMLAAARRVAAGHRAAPCRERGMPSDALVTLARGYKALRITSHEENPPERLPEPPDGLARIDYRAVADAVDFIEATVREIATAPSTAKAHASIVTRR